MNDEINITELTALQKAYLNGEREKYGMKTKACYLYECRENEPLKVMRAVERLINAHPALQLNPDLKSFDMPEMYPPYETEDIYAETEKIFSDDAVLEKSLVNFYLITQGETLFLVLYCSGIFIDGFSHELIKKQLDEIYCGSEIECSDYEIDILKKSEDYIRNESGSEDEIYWQNAASDMPAPPEFPTISPNTEIGCIHSFNERIFLENEVFERLGRIASENHVTLFSLLLSALGKVLSRYTPANDFRINLPYSMRRMSMENEENYVGLFSDFLVMSLRNKPDQVLSESAEEIFEEFMDACDHSAYGGMNILSQLRKADGNSLGAPIVFTSTAGQSSKGRQFLRRLVRTQTSQVWLEILIVECEEKTELSFTAAKEMYDREMIRDMAEMFAENLKIISSDPGLFRNSAAAELSKKHTNTVEALTNTIQETDETPIVSRYIENFEKYSDRLAIQTIDKSITYSELKKTTDVIAASLLRLTENGTSIGIFMDKSPLQIEVALAAVCAGIAYLPFDTELPPESVSKIMYDAGLSVIIADEKYISMLEKSGCVCVNADTLIQAQTEKKVLKYAEPLNDDTVVMIYTSGTTGEPKGVRLTHRGLLNCFAYTEKIFSLSEKDGVIAITNFCHDMAIFDTLGMFFVGGKVIVPDNDKKKDPKHWKKLAEKHGATVWNSVPAFMDMFTQSLAAEEEKMECFNKVILGGDRISVSLAERMFALLPTAELFSVGGPTETTVWNIYHRITKKDLEGNLIPYGAPFPNTEYYIFDEDMNICPLGVKGTIFVSGVGVTSGYIANESETEKRYICLNGKHLYNTGDIGSYSPEGEILIHGRKDLQVKINGKRIELSGIEQKIMEVDGVECCAVVKNRRTEKLTAFYSTASESITAEYVHDQLEKKLPAYMVPSVIEYIAEFPLTKNGKIDRRILEETETTVKEKNIKTSALMHTNNHIMDGIMECCRSLFENDNITPDMNFYYMGGDSVNSIKLISMIKKRFGVEFSVYDVLENPFPEEWEKLIEKKLEQNSNIIIDEWLSLLHSCVSDKISNLLEADNIIEAAEKISEISGGNIPVLYLLSHPFPEDWAKYGKE